MRTLVLLFACMLAPLARSADFPAFAAQDCCALCPQAAEPARYESGYLRAFARLFEGREGWLFRTENDLPMSFGPSAAGAESLRDFSARLAARGIRLVMVVQPTRGMMHPERLPANLPVAFDAGVARARYAESLARIRAQGIVVPDLTALLNAPREHDYFFRADHHWTPEGARLTARHVAEAVRRMPEHRALPRQRFVSTQNGLLAKRGTMDRAARLLCGHGAPEQYVPRYVTEPAEALSGNDALFGEASTPRVALVGTSNSDSAYNFPGFLAEYLETDVFSAGLPGGGFDGAMLAYLSSREFHAHPPAILIWEVQAYHDLDSPSFYRQARPLMENGCEGRRPILERTVKLKPGRNEVLVNGGANYRALAGARHFLDLQFENRNVQRLDSMVWYVNGSKDDLRIERPSQGRFVFDLRRDANWGKEGFLSLDVHVDDTPGAPPPASLRARLCSYDTRAEPAHTARAEVSP